MKKYFRTELIDEFRKQNKLTIEEFCKLCNISVATYYKIINQQLNFRASAIFKIARGINIGMHNLYC